MTDARADQEQAAREAGARRQLLEAGASSLPRPPWLSGSQPPAADLIHFALWHDPVHGPGEDILLAALTLLPAARAEMDQAEAALLWTAQAGGLSWPQISRAMGLASAQAAQQRFGRVTGRVEYREA